MSNYDVYKQYWNFQCNDRYPATGSNIRKMSGKKLIKCVEVSLHREFVEENNIDRDLIDNLSDKLDVFITDNGDMRLRGDYVEIKNLNDNLSLLLSERNAREKKTRSLSNETIKVGKAYAAPEIASRRNRFNCLPRENNQMWERLSIASIRDNNYKTNEGFCSDFQSHSEEFKKREGDYISPGIVSKKQKLLCGIEGVQIRGAPMQFGPCEEIPDSCSDVAITLRRLSTNDDNNHSENECHPSTACSPDEEFPDCCEMSTGHEDFEDISDEPAQAGPAEAGPAASPAPRFEEIRTFRARQHDVMEPHAIMTDDLMDDDSFCNSSASFVEADDSSFEENLPSNHRMVASVQTGCSLYDPQNERICESHPKRTNPEVQVVKKSSKNVILQQLNSKSSTISEPQSVGSSSSYIITD